NLTKRGASNASRQTLESDVPPRVANRYRLPRRDSDHDRLHRPAWPARSALHALLHPRRPRQQYAILRRSLAWPPYRDVLDPLIDRATNRVVPCVLGSRLYRRPRSNRLSGLHGSATRAVFRGDRAGAGGRTPFRTLAAAGGEGQPAITVLEAARLRTMS